MVNGSDEQSVDPVLVVSVCVPWHEALARRSVVCVSDVADDMHVQGVLDRLLDDTDTKLVGRPLNAQTDVVAVVLWLCVVDQRGAHCWLFVCWLFVVLDHVC